MLVFNMFQHPSLNRRLLLVLFENLLIALFPKNKMGELFQKLHSASPRISYININTNSEDKTQEQLIDNKEAQSTIEVNPEVVQVKKEPTREKPPTKSAKESKSKLNLQCLSQQSVHSPKPSKKRKKSIETAVFYTDYGVEEDTVILPLGR